MGMNENISFNNMDSWNGGVKQGDKNVLNVKQMIMEHIKRCILHGSVEFKGGYWNVTIGADGGESKSYIASSYDVFTNSVKMLRCVMMGYFDKRMEEVDLRLQEEAAMRLYELNTKDKDELRDNGWFEYETQNARILLEQLILLAKRLNFFEDEAGEESV